MKGGKNRSETCEVGGSVEQMIRFEVDRYRRDKGIEYVIGVDEAGRGPLAGPVVAASCCFKGDPFESMNIAEIRDSKLITSEEEREMIYEKLMKHPNCIWGVSVQSNEVIDQVNILQATMLAMHAATSDLLSKHKQVSQSDKVMVLVDGNRVPENMPCASESVVKGDSLAYSISAASVIAKVTRDRIMNDLHKQYPAYGFDSHKGYPSPSHRMILSQVGPCPEHRVSYRPVREAAEKHGDKVLLDRARAVDARKEKVKKDTSSSPKSKGRKGGGIKALTPVKAVRASPKSPPNGGGKRALFNNPKSPPQVTRSMRCAIL